MATKTIVRGGRLLDSAGRSAPAVDLLVEDGRIAAHLPPNSEAPSDAALFNAAGTLMHPGLVNGHTHGMGNLCKGGADRWTLELLWVGAASMMDNQSLEVKYLNTYLGAVEMLTKGCTTCYDLTFGFPIASVPEMVAMGQAYADAGMRVVLAPMLADLNFYQAIPGLLDALPPDLARQVAASEETGGDGILAMMREALTSWPHDSDRVRLGVSPIIPLHCTDAFMLDCVRMAREFGVPLHSHVAESKTQAVAALKRYGRTITAHIDGLGLLGPDFTVAHGVWLDDDDMRRLADRGATIAHNPGSNMRLGSGIADARRMLELGVNLAVGTDSANCSDNQNMYEAMRYASMVSNVRGPDHRRWLTTPEIIAAATRGGAQATGFADIGSLDPGMRADIVFLGLDSVNWMPVNDPANQLVLSEDGTGVRHVMVGGDFKVKGGRHLSCDMASLAAKCEAARAHLAEANAPARLLADQLDDVVASFCTGLSRAPYHVERYAAPHAH